MPPTRDGRSDSTTDATAVKTAFSELHNARLFGFALLLTLGDRDRAASITAAALADADPTALRHPERAAATLRRRVVSLLGRRGPQGASTLTSRFAFGDMSVDGAVISGLQALTSTERAALVASHVEGFDIRDVATIVGRDGGSLDRLMRRAAQKYAAAYVASAPDAPAAAGRLAGLINETAERALA
jgi:hypothetical protein